MTWIDEQSSSHVKKLFTNSVFPTEFALLLVGSQLVNINLYVYM